MTAQAFRTAREPPDLRSCNAALSDLEILVVSILRHQSGVCPRVVPLVGQPIKTVLPSNQNASLNTLGARMIARSGLQLEMFDPYASHRKCPVPLRRKIHFLVYVRNCKPAILQGAVGPKWHIHIVRIDSIIRLQRSEILKNTSFTQR